MVSSSTSARVGASSSPDTHYTRALNALRAFVATDIWSEQSVEVVDLGNLERRYQLWHELLPEVTPYYAVKCRDDGPVLASLAALGCGFDCASRAEMESVLALGVSPERIIYANPSKPVPSLLRARQAGVKAMTFDNEPELYKIAGVFPDAELVLRVRVDDSYAAEPLGAKFGAEKDTLRPLLQTARKLGLNVIGVSFHVGCGCQDAEAYRKAVERAHEAFDIGAEVGYEFSLLDIGGGFPGSDIHANIHLEDIASKFNAALAEFFPSTRGVRIISEPGQYFARKCSMLATGIVSKRVVREGSLAALSRSQVAFGCGSPLPSRNENASSDSVNNAPLSPIDPNGEKPQFMYYINDGAYGTFVVALLRRAKMIQISPQVLLRRRDIPSEPSKGIPFTMYGQEGEVYESIVYGPTCDSGDKVLERMWLPELDMGDWLYFDEIGSYTRVAATSFNGMLKPKVYYVNTQDSPNTEMMNAASAIGVKVIHLNDREGMVPRRASKLADCSAGK